MKIKKNDNLQITIDALTSEGSGIGRYEGFAIFVRGVVVGDVIDTHIIKVSKNYAVGIINKIITPSINRIESDCEKSKQCGGCSFRNMTYDAELQYKKSRVQEALGRIGKIDFEVKDIIGANEIYRYRNKAQYPVEIKNGELLAGFYAYKSHRIVPCSDCKLQPIEFEQGLKAFTLWVMESGVTSYDEASGRGLLRHIYFRKAFGTGDIMVCAVINANTLPNSDRLVELLRKNIQNVKSISFNVNKDKTNVILSNETHTIWGDEYIVDKLLGKEFEISPNSFYQVNHDQCEKLYAKAAHLANLTGKETLIDLYCGAGTIGITMADKVKNLIGIEVVEQAVDNAIANAKRNGVNNARYICADAAKGAEILAHEGVTADVIVLDPPRKGCSSQLLDTLEKFAAKKIVYISCDSATLARDLRVLEDKGYKVNSVTAVDMFPRTPHVESVVLVEK